MKNLSKKLMVLLSVLMAAIFICGCGSSSVEKTSKSKKEKTSETEKVSAEKAIIGEWEAEWDFSEMMKQAILEEDEDMADYFKFKNLTINISVKFKKDGTYSSEIDEDSLEDLRDNFIDALKDGMEDYLSDILKENGETRSVKEYVKDEAGVTLDEYIEELAEDFNLESLVEDFTDSGNYKIKGNKLYTWDEDDEMDEDEYIKFTISDDTMKWTEFFGEDVDEVNDYLVPMVFTKK